MQVGNITIRQLFQQDRRHVVPLYQRPYVWQQETQWEPLWEDIRAVAERLMANPEARSHFIGAIVLEYVPQHAGALEVRLVIDGQQRLTTVQLLLEAIYDYCDTIGAKALHQSVKRLVRNDEPMSTNPIDQYKVWPTNVDRDHFERVMEARSPDELKQLYDQPASVTRLNQPILDGYLFFYESVSAWVDEVPDQREPRLTALIQSIKDRVGLVVIDVGKEDDAQVIFETLNARGTPLLPSDLVKNHLFHHAEIENENLDLLYKQYWQPFEEGKNYWREEIGRGHAKRARIDLFLQNYLCLRIRDEVPVGHLYATFRETTANPESGNAKEHLQRLRRYADLFQGFDKFEEGTRQALFFTRLEAMELGTTYPFLMELFAIHGAKSPEVERVLEIVESYLVRRLVCQLTTRSYGRFFIDLIPTLDGPIETLAERVRTELLKFTGEGARWPDDEEFRSSWLTARIYRTILRSRLRMLLEALDLDMEDGFGEKYILKEKLTIEHLLPQEWKTAHWKLPDDATAEMVAARDGLLHTMGNLTLLTGKLNPKISNGKWERKIKEIGDRSKLNLNLDLCKHWSEGWGEDQIVERGKKLFERALKIWPR
ncbi:MAG: DUF262 domain-containing protein [Caldilineales bacterium]|nr:DUF262 domain-containing protein [Planctomycetales bacterium]MCW5856699.1 DUF262 domain-containing protein [Caldilineales bacterium]